MKNSFNGRKLILGTADDVHDLAEEGIVKFDSVGELYDWLHTVSTCTGTGQGEIEQVTGDLTDPTVRAQVKRRAKKNRAFVSIQAYPCSVDDFEKISRLQDELRKVGSALVVGSYELDTVVDEDASLGLDAQVSW